MPLQIRRGSTADRLASTPLIGEIVYDTTTKAVYIGDGTTAGGLPVTSFSVADSRSTTAKMFLGDSLSDNTGHSGVTFALVGNRLQAVVQQDLSNYIGLITADEGFKGSLWAEDSGLIVDSETHTVYGNFVPQGHIVPDANIAYDLGTSTRRFRDIYLSGSSIYLGDAVITSTGTAINFPLGSTVGGQALGINEGDTYNITVSGNVIGTDSTVLVNATNGTFHGDLRGSVFADDSTILVDGQAGVLRGTLIGTLTGNVTGDLTGTASTASVASTVSLDATNSSTSTHYITFSLNATGNEAVRTDTGITYQPSSNRLTVTALSSTDIIGSSITGNIFTSLIDSADSSAINVVPAIIFNSDVTLENELFVGGDVFPSTSESYSLGSYTRKFNKLYLAEGANALWIGNAAISGSGSIIDLPAGTTVGGSAISTSASSIATAITVNTTGISADHFVSFFDDQTGDNSIYTSSNFKFNPGTGRLTVSDATIGTVTGNLVGNVTGNIFTSLIDSADSSAITVTPAVIFNSDISAENDLTVRESITVGGAIVIGGETHVDIGHFLHPRPQSGSIADHYIPFLDTLLDRSPVQTAGALRYNPGSATLTATNLIAGVINSTTVNAPTINTTDIAAGTITSASLMVLGSTLSTGTQRRLVQVGSGLIDGRFGVVTNTYYGAGPFVGFTQAHNTADVGNIQFIRFRGTTEIPTTTLTGDDIADLTFSAHNGTTTINSVNITVKSEGTIVAGTTGVGAVPGRIEIQTANAAGTLTDAVVINSRQQTTFGGAIGLAVYANAAARDDAIPTPTAGMMVFNTTSTKFQGYTGAAWVDLN
jgi:hypothetical protein